MALPTSLPPTLASWAVRREREETDAQRLWKGVPIRAAEQRAKFVREALRGALTGLEQLHVAGLLHQVKGLSVTTRHSAHGASSSTWRGCSIRCEGRAAAGGK